MLTSNFQTKMNSTKVKFNLKTPTRTSANTTGLLNATIPITDENKTTTSSNSTTTSSNTTTIPYKVKVLPKAIISTGNNFNLKSICLILSFVVLSSLY